MKFSSQGITFHRKDISGHKISEKSLESSIYKIVVSDLYGARGVFGVGQNPLTTLMSEIRGKCTGECMFIRVSTYIRMYVHTYYTHCHTV